MNSRYDDDQLARVM